MNKRLVGWFLVVMVILSAVWRLRAEELPVNPHLKNVNYVRIQCLINDIAVYKAYPSPRVAEKKEYNFKKAAEQFKDTSIPFTQENIQALYMFLEERLQRGGVRILDVKKPKLEAQGYPTIIPVVSLDVELQEVTSEYNVMLVSLTISKWLSTWSGSEQVKGPVIVWIKKRMVVIDNDEFSPKLKETVEPLVAEFLAHLAVANPPEPATETETGNKPGKTDVDEEDEEEE